jgi:predicted metal-dependent hydrolase
VIDYVAPHVDFDAFRARCSLREQRIIEMKLSGCQQIEIAAALGVTPAAVCQWLRDLRRRWDVLSVAGPQHRCEQKTLRAAAGLGIRSGHRRQVPALLERKKNWIRAAMEKAESHRKFFEPEPVWRLPSEIKLAAIGLAWNVRQRETDVPWVAAREITPSTLLVFGKVDDERTCRASLNRWLMRQTRQHLVPRLEELSRRTGLRPKRLLVKKQRTRWASCSRHRTISLNARLLFLPSELVDYAIIHELCHLSEMNHSDRFWRLVRHHCPDFQKRDAQLREMWKRLPRWATWKGTAATGQGHPATCADARR